MIGINLRRVRDYLEQQRKGKDAISEMRGIVGQMRDELDDHLDAINENTNEICSHYEQLTDVEAKIAKLAERIDDIQNTLARNFITDPLVDEPAPEEYKVGALTFREQEVFLALYTIDGSDGATYSLVAKRTGLTDEIVQRYVQNLIIKGVPVVKRYRDGTANLSLEESFKGLQAKHNLVKINDSIKKQLSV
ncbi:hypothetical protein JXB02_00505 [Candidatus Woesearchaeota archaeon]|nr:hypothetical protein [Candidatus Woesearchaeota archaeon]